MYATRVRHLRAVGREYTATYATHSQEERVAQVSHVRQGIPYYSSSQESHVSFLDYKLDIKKK